MRIPPNAGYITENRALIEGVYAACRKYGVDYTVFSDEWILRLRRHNRTRFIYGYHFDCNRHASNAIAYDKVATYLLLADNELPSVEHYLLKSVVDSSIDRRLLETLFDRHASLVIKPLQGSRGEDVRRFDRLSDVAGFVDRNLAIPAWAASPYLSIDREVRLVVLHQTVHVAYEKVRPPRIHSLKMYNLNLGASAQPLRPEDIDGAWRTLALEAMKAIGLTLGAVDIVIDRNGQARVLEINAGFSLEHYALLSGTARNQVIEFYGQVMKELFEIV